MKKKILCTLLVFCIMLGGVGPVFASEMNELPVGTSFSTIPSEYDLRLMDRCQDEEPVNAWVVDSEGNQIPVAPVDMSNNNTRSFIEGRYEYTFVRYDQSVTKQNDYQHFVSSCSFRNQGTKPVTMHYTQEATVNSEWSVTGKIDVEADLKVAVLASLQAKFGSSVLSLHRTASSDKWEFDLEVPVGKTGKISKYYAGKYSGGQGVWLKEDIISGSTAGYYYEEATAWGIAKNEVNWDWTIK